MDWVTSLQLGLSLLLLSLEKLAKVKQNLELNREAKGLGVPLAQCQFTGFPVLVPYHTILL